MPTATVALVEGTNSGIPSTLGTAPLTPKAGRRAIRKCQSAKATKTTLTHKARAVFNAIEPVRYFVCEA
jgi:hypothetical protein